MRSIVNACCATGCLTTVTIPADGNAGARAAVGAIATGTLSGRGLEASGFSVVVIELINGNWDWRDVTNGVRPARQQRPDRQRGLPLRN